MDFAHRVLKKQQHTYKNTTSLRTACTCNLGTASNLTMSRGPSIQTKQRNRQQFQIKKVSIIITVSVTVQCTSKAQQVISHARPSLCNLLLSCFFHFHIHFFAIASPYQATLLAQDVKLMHQANTKEAKSTVMHPSQRVLYIWCARLQVVVVVVQSSFVVKKRTRGDE